MTLTAAYDADALEEPAEAVSGSWLREVIVHVSMMIVIAALGMALRTSFGFGVLPAIITVLTIYWGLLVVHALVRRGQAAADLGEEVAHLADENAALRRLVGARRAASVERAPPRLDGLGVDRAPPRVLDRSARPTGGLPNPGPESRTRENPVVPESAKPRSAPAPAPIAPKATAAPPARPVVMARGGRQESAAPAKKPASGSAGPRAAPPSPPPLPARPRPHGLAALAVEKPAVKPPVETPREISGPPDVEDPRAQDIAIMQSLIKGLADQLNGPHGKAEVPHALVAPAPATPSSFDTLDVQVEALRDMADDMRGSMPAPTTARNAAPRSVAPSTAPGVHEALERAIEESRIHVYLDPILGLDDRRARHFEVSVCLSSDDGEILDPRALAGSIAGTGLAPRIDALTFTETIRLAGEFAARDTAADLFSTATGEALRDGGFHAALSGALAPDPALGARLVMSIAQAEARAFGPAHWDALAALSDAGLRYALVDVVDLDMDFEELADRGFEFVRLDAQVFLQGLPAPHDFVPAADLCRHLSGLGFTLIVSRIAEERELVKVLGFGALLGQGRLFGGPRPIRQERTAREPSAA